MSVQKSENHFDHLPIQEFARLSSAATGESHSSSFGYLLSKLTCLFAEISSVALGGRVLSVSDDFFAEAYHLLLVEVGGGRILFECST
jgi:allantoicase